MESRKDLVFAHATNADGPGHCTDSLVHELRRCVRLRAENCVGFGTNCATVPIGGSWPADALRRLVRAPYFRQLKTPKTLWIVEQLSDRVPSVGLLSEDEARCVR